MYKLCFTLVLINLSQPLLPIKKVSDYAEQLPSVKEWSRNLENEQFYEKKFTFKNGKTDEVRSFNKFTDLQKRMFFLIAAEEITRKLEKMQESWLRDFTDLPFDDGKEANLDEPVKRANLQKLMLTLNSLRKEHAARWEATVERTFQDFGDKFTDKEKQNYLKVMRAYNDKHKLIERP